MTQEIDQSDSQARSPEATTLAETSSSPVSGSVNVTPKPDLSSPQGPVPTGPSDCRQAVGACALSKFRKWFKAGFGSELLPIIPPDAQLREGSTVSEHMRGKVPGVRNSDGTWSGLGGKWSAPDWKPSVADLKRWERDGASLGVQGRRLPQIDSDVEDEQTAEGVETLVLKHFGLSPVRLHEGSPRRLYMFRCDGLRKIQLAWHDRNGIKHAVEALCQGQQGVHDSPHAKGGRYTYRFNESPADWGFDALTEITPAAVEGFFGELAAYVEASGGTIERRAGAAYTASIGARLSLDDISLHAPSPEPVIEALKGWPNDGDSLPSHDDFVQAMAAIKAALGPHREDYYGDVEQWALEYPGNDDDYVRKVWDSITDASLGADWLLKTAGASGAVAQADFADDVEEVNAAIGDTGRDRMLKRYVWVEGLGRYHDIQRGSFLDARKFNAANITVKPFGLSGMKTAEAIFQNHPKARKVAIVTFRPGDPVITTEENEYGLRVEAINLWRPSSLKPRFGAEIAPYDDVLTRLFGEPGASEREHFLDWWAYLLQNPGKKIGHALLLVGSQGVGKDTILSPLFAAVGRHNVATIDTNTLSNQWTFYLKRQVIYAQEIITHGRRDLYNHIKPLITAQDTHLLVNEKNLPQYFVPNLQNWIFTSNHDNAVALEDNDRRFWVHRVLAEEAAPAEYFQRFRSWLAAGGSEAVYGWLLKRDVSKFNPMAEPPLTAAKRVMLDHSQPMPVRWLRDRFEEGEAFYGRTVLTVPEVQATASRDWSAPDDLNAKHVMAALKNEGFSSALRVRLSDGMRQLWVRDPAGLLRQLSAEKLRERYVAETGNMKLGEASRGN